jgi:hypothetical protein
MKWRLSHPRSREIAGREDAKNMKNMCQPNTPDVGRIIVEKNAKKATRY